MISTEEFSRLLRQAVGDPTAEPAVLRALLEVTVYAHTPRNDCAGRVRFIQFNTPEGLTVLPFFSDKTQAEAAAGHLVTIVAMVGRRLFEATRGAILILNPNTFSCLLYPEEISALLDRGEVAVINRICADGQLVIQGFCESPAWLLDRLTSFCARMNCIEAAFLAKTGRPDAPGHDSLLIAIAVSPKYAERVMRGATTELQTQCRGLQTSLDLLALDPDNLPEWISELGLRPFYERALAGSIDPAQLKRH